MCALSFFARFLTDDAFLTDDGLLCFCLLKQCGVDAASLSSHASDLTICPEVSLLPSKFARPYAQHTHRQLWTGPTTPFDRASPTFFGERDIDITHSSMAPPDPVMPAAATSSNSNKRRRRMLLHEVGQAQHANDIAAAAAAAASSSNASNNGQQPPPQLTLGLGAGFEGADLRLLEATPEVLAALTDPGAPLRVVGCEKEATVALVTGDATFEMCRVETSNMLLLVPPFAPTAEGAGAGGPEAVGHVAFHYEVGCVSVWRDFSFFLRPTDELTYY